MYQPQGFEGQSTPDLICKLNKAIYGLKQALKTWFLKLFIFLLNFCFQNLKANTSMFVQFVGIKVNILLVYVNDIILTGDDSNYLRELTSLLHTKFALKDLGDLNFFLGI